MASSPACPECHEVLDGGMTVHDKTGETQPGEQRQYETYPEGSLTICLYCATPSEWRGSAWIALTGREVLELDPGDLLPLKRAHAAVVAHKAQRSIIDQGVGD